jgi:hypothetical protein
MTDDRVVEITDKLKAHLASKDDDQLRACSGLGLPQPEQHAKQLETLSSWEPFRTSDYGGQHKGYANVPLLVTTELLRRETKSSPTVSAVIERTVKDGFTTPKGAKVTYGFLRGYINSAQGRGFCRLR